MIVFRNNNLNKTRDTVKGSDPYEQEKAKNHGEQLHIDLGRELTDEEAKIFEQLKQGLDM